MNEDTSTLTTRTSITLSAARVREIMRTEVGAPPDATVEPENSYLDDIVVSWSVVTHYPAKDAEE